MYIYTHNMYIYKIFFPYSFPYIFQCSHTFPYTFRMNVCAYLGPMGVFVSSPFLGALKSSDPAEIAGAIRWNHGGSRCAASLCLGP